MKVRVSMARLIDDFPHRYDRFNKGHERIECEAYLPENGGRYLVVKAAMEAHVGVFELISATNKEKAELKKRKLIKG